MNGNPRIFLSHSHWDRHSATDIQNVLESHGAETYLDQDEIRAGDNLPDRILQGIRWCNFLLLIWSSNAATSNWVDKEWNTAYDLRKKIIPYSLDSTPLPHILQNLVRVEINDREHGDAGLLRAVLGTDFRPDPTTLFPGHWSASMDAFGIAQGTYELVLRENGQVDGSGGIEQSGVAGDIARSLGVSGMLNMRVPIQGSWSYDRGAQTLTIKITATGLGSQNADTVVIRTTGKERGAIKGSDLAGRTWKLERID